MVSEVLEKLENVESESLHAPTVAMTVSDMVLVLIALEKDRAQANNVWTARKGVKVSSGTHCLRMNRYLVSRAIWSARAMLQNPTTKGKRAPYRKMIAAMDKRCKFMLGLPCANCRMLIRINDICIGKRGSHGTTKFYDLKCAERLNIV